MALPNTEKLTSQLATLPDVALRQMAQMHKNDPYILPLVIAEDSRRKQMRAASQAQRGAMPQPKVVDAAVQQVGQLPEEVGIGALPTPNMTQMAGGGITGDDYDMVVGEPSSVPGYAGGGEPGVYERWKSMSTPYSGRVWGESPTAFSDFLSGVGQSVAEFVSPEQAEADRKKAAEMAAAEERMRGYRPRRSGSETEQALEERILEARAGVGVPGPEAPTPSARKTPGADSNTRSAPASARAPSAPAPAPNLSDIYRTARTEADNTADPRLQEIQRQVEELGTSGIDAARENIRLTEERQAKFADAYKGREERLSKREAQLQSDEGKNTGLALLQAGLAIMSTPGNLATAVGKGGQAGLAAYGAGLERLRAAQERLADARDRLDEVKLNRDEMSAKELQEAKLGEKRAVTEAKKAGIDFGMKAYGLSEERAKMFYESSVRLAQTKMEQEGADRRASMAASAPPEILKLARAFGGGDIEAGLRKVTEIQAGKFDPRKAYSEYLGILAKNPGAGEPMNFSQFIGQFAIPTVSGDNSAAPGTTRARP